ncbi:hypothetical protein Tco_0787462 [Tanacetum coccineum]
MLKNKKISLLLKIKRTEAYTSILFEKPSRDGSRNCPNQYYFKVAPSQKGEYDIWKLRIEQYFQVQDYALWDVIENGNSFKPAAQTTTNADGSSTTLIPGPTLFTAIQTRFGGNDATKKTQKTLLKQMYENLSAPSTESLDSIFNRLQKIIVEQEVKGTANSSSSSSSQNLAFMSSTRSTNEVNTAYGVSTASTQVNTANLSDDTNTINGSVKAGYDKSKGWSVSYYQVGSLCKECRGLGIKDNSTMKKSSSKLALMAFQTLMFNKSEFNLATYKRGLASVEEQLVFYKKNKVLFCEQHVVLKRDISYKDSEISVLKRSQIPDKSRKGLGFPEFEGYGPNTSKCVSKDTSNEVRESPDASLVEELVSNDNFDHMHADCNYHQRERLVSGNNYTRVKYIYSTKKAHPSAHRNMFPKEVLMKTGLRPLNTARPINFAHPKTTVYSARLMSRFSKLAQSTVKRPYQRRTALPNKNFSQKVNTAKGSFYTARPNSAVVNASRQFKLMPIKGSACWVWRPTNLTCIVKNPMFHSKTKHIENRHHFIRDSNEKKLIQMIKIHTNHNVADLLTNAFDVGRFQYLIASIGMLNL